MSYFINISGVRPQCRRLRDNVVPSVFRWSKDPSTSTLDRQKRLIRRQAKQQIPLPEQSLPDEDIVMDVGAEVDVIDVNQNTQGIPSSAEDIPLKHATTQTNTIILQDAATDPLFLHSDQSAFSCHKFIHNSRAIHHYTGLEDYDRFCFVLNTLGHAAYELSYMYGSPPRNISVENMFFLSLIKLRRHTTNFELSLLFNIYESGVYNIFNTWIRFMSLQWREVSFWIPKDLVNFYAPYSFQEEYPATRVIIDGTECPVKKPALPTAQQATFSTYKNRNTLGCHLEAYVHMYRMLMGVLQVTDRSSRGVGCQRCVIVVTLSCQIKALMYRTYLHHMVSL